MKRSRIVLIGMAGSGKSTVGSLLAEALDFEFTDLDEYIRLKEGCSLQAIIDVRGEETLLDLEDRYMREIVLERRVVAPGGSVIYQPALMEYLKEHSTLVFLDETFENLERRLKNAPARGIVGFKNKSLRAIYIERRPLYAAAADITIAAAGKSPEEVVREILQIFAGFD